MKRIGPLFLALLVLLAGCGSQKPGRDQGEDGTPKIEPIDKQFAGQTLKVVAFTEDMRYAASIFEQAYASKVDLVIRDKKEWEADPVAFMEKEGGDVYTIEAAHMEKWLAADVLLSLTEVSAENYAPYTTAYATNQAGDLKALTWSITPVHLYYRRSIAKEILGDDSPEAVKGAMADMEGILDFSAKLQAGGYKILADSQDMRAFYLPGDKAETNVLSAEEEFFLTSVRQMETDYRLAGLAKWSPSWIKGMYGKATNTITGNNINIFAYVLPSWAKTYVLEKAGDDTEENTREQNPTWGDWAMTGTLNPRFSAGIWLGIDKQSDKGDMAKAFLLYLTQNQEFLDGWLDRTKEIPAFLPILEAYGQAGKGDSFLGGQDALALYLQAAKAIPAKSAQALRQEEEYYALLQDFIKGNVATLEDLKAKLASPASGEEGGGQ